MDLPTELLSTEIYLGPPGGIQSWEGTLVTAPGDGIAPAVLLTLGQRLKGQYLFNVPEGFSRLVLEHRVRPTAGLRAAFATDLPALAGFGGLVMRLRNEGHGQLHVVGPPGTRPVVGSLRHFIHWKHPAVLVSEVTEWESPVCYEDEHIAVAALWKPPLVGELWQAPPWLLGPTQQAPSVSVTRPSGSSSGSSSSEGSGDGSSSEEEEDSESSSGGSGSSSSNSRGGSGSESSSSGSGSCTSSEAEGEGSGGDGAGEELTETSPATGAAAAQAAHAAGPEAGGAGVAHAAGQQAVTGQQAAAAPASMFEELDQIFLRGAGRVGSGPPGPNRATRLNVLERLRAAQAVAPAAAGPAAAAAPANGARAGAAVGKPVAPAKAAVAAAAAAAPRRRPAPAAVRPSAETAGGGAAGGDAGGKVHVVGGKPYRQLAGAAGISLYVHDKLSSRARPGPGATLPGAGGASDGARPQLLGFLCHTKATDQLLLVGNVWGRGAVRQLQDHPALERLRQQGERAAGSVLLGEAGFGKWPQLRRLAAGLPGQHVLLERPGVGASQDLGHLAGARTTAKLHLVSPLIYPLPPALETSPPGAGAAPEQAAVLSTGGAAAPAGQQLGEQQQEKGQQQQEQQQQEKGQQELGNGSAFPVAVAISGEKAAPHDPEVQQQQQVAPAGLGVLHPNGALATAEQQEQQAALGSQKVISVRCISRAVWRGGSSSAAIPPPQPATAAAAERTSAPASRLQTLLRLDPIEVFSPEAASGKGAEGRPSGADPAAVWRELEESKDQLAARLAGVQGAAEAIARLPAQPAALPRPNSLQPGLSAQRQAAAQQPPAPAGSQQLAAPGAQVQQPWRQQPQQQPVHSMARHPGGGAAYAPPSFPAQVFGVPPPHPHYAAQQPGMMAPLPGPFPPPPPAPPGMMWVLQPTQPLQPLPPPYVGPPAYPAPAPARGPWQQPPLAPYSSLPPQPGYCPPALQQPGGAAAPPLHSQGPPAPGSGAGGIAGGRAPYFYPPPPPGAPPPGPPANGTASGGGQELGGTLGKRPSAAQQQQEQQQACNKRAAADLRARLLQQPAQDGQAGGAQAAAEPPPASPAAAAPSDGSSAGAAGGASDQQPGSDRGAAAPPAAAAAATPGSRAVGDWAAGAPDYLRALVEAGDGTQVVFLGTGSAEPSKYRSASAIHLRLDCGQGLLLDCGEGCLGQMVRMYGHRGASQQVAALACIWLSHRHADHMLGLLGVLGAYPAHLPPLLVIGPASARDWLAEAAPGLRLRYSFAHCLEVNNPGHWARRQLAERLGIMQLESVGVRHCSDAYGVVVGHRCGWRLLYSGDTQPCDRLVQAGRGCTLLIHEATFEPCLADQAARKRHSTTAEALAVAEAMGAYRTILTHFSQRYPKFPEGLPAEGPAASTTAIAFDCMRVPLAALPLLPTLRPAVEYVLASEEAEEGVEEGAAAQARGAGS